MIVVDTDIIIDFSRDISAAVDTIDHLQGSGETLAVSVVTAMELIIGCRTKKEMRQIESFLKQFQTIHLCHVISERALQLIRAFYHSHSLLIPDALIAASAVLTNSMLYTKNVRHFRMIPGLRVQRPY